MSTTVDQRVVEMKFDNQQFESNVGTTMSTLDKLKESLNFKGASKGLDDVNAASKRCDMGALGSAVETVQAKFSALEVIGVTALANITNQAVNTGKRMISALTIDPIKTGFQEYETQINAVQTILANTESKGSTLEDVNQALRDLNEYADLTIYNFTEMTRNIGTFTAAGVDLETSTTAIQGIANLAAVSGSTSQQASTAMYQLSQALSSGTVKLQDWNSVVNAGMGGQVFQDALKKTAKAHGVAVDEMIEKNGSFRESLQEGWITSEILTETLGKMTKSGAAEYLSDLTGISKKEITDVQDAVNDGADSYDKLVEKMAKTNKVSKDEALEILKMADTATNAATKVKTFTQLWDTLTEAAQSGWTQSWEIIIGDFEEAKELLTNVSDTISEMINESAKARNDILKGWKDLGGRNDLIDAFKNSFEALMSVVKPIGEAFKNVFPPVTAQTLANITSALKDFTSKLIVSDETADKIKRTFQGVFSVFDIFRKILVTIGTAIGSFLGGGAVSGILDMLLSFTAAIGDFFTTVDKGFDTSSITGAISSIVGAISGAIGKIASGASGFGDALSNIGKTIGGVFGEIWDSVKFVFDWISQNVTVGDIFAGLVGGGLFVGIKKLIGVFGNLKDMTEGGLLGILFGGGGDGNPVEGAKGIKESFSDILGSVNETLQSFTSGIKVGSVVAIAAAIGILAHALKTISELDAIDTVKGLGAIGAMMAMLSFEFKSLLKSLDAFNSKGIIKAGVSLILVATAIKILSGALVEIGKLSLAEVGKGLLGIGGSLLILVEALKVIDKVKIPVRTTIAILALAESCKILADALKSFGEMEWEAIARGLVAMGGALAEMVGTLAILDKVGGVKSLVGSASLLIAVQALDDMAEALKKFGSMSWEQIGHGLVGMGGALAEVAIACGVLGKIAGFSGILGAGAIAVVSESLDEIADALQKFGFMSWEEIARGLVGMGGALAEVATACGVLGKIAGFSAIVGSGAILMVVEGLDELASAFQKFGYMSWDDIARGLVGMGGALAEVAGVSGALGKIAGFSGIVGSGAILIVVQGLGDLSDSFGKFGGMSWEEIARGLVGMGGALGEVAIISGALGALAGLPALLGGGAILLAVQGLGDLADALKKFGEMEWDEIGRGLTAMGAALGETALGALLNTFSGFGANAIATMAEPLGALADSVKKWEGVSVPDGLGAQLGNLASGVWAFTLDGWGAEALATIAEPLGVLADSISKWSDVSVPEGLGDQIASLAGGIGAFTFDGFGAGVIETIAEPLGALADSIAKWEGLTVPENLGTQLESLANGIGAFTFDGLGAGVLSTIAEPLGTLVDSVLKWKDVTVPEDLGTQLENLSNGINSLSVSFTSGITLNAIAEPLNTLASAVEKFSGLKIPEDLGDKMKTFSSDISTLATNLSSMPSVDSAKLNSLSEAVDKLNTALGKISSDKTKDVESFVTAVNKLGGIKVDSDSLSKTASSVSSSVNSMMKTLNSTISSGMSAVSDSMSTAMSGMSDAIKSTSGAVTSAAGDLVTALTSAISSKTSSTTSAFKALVSGASNAVKTQYSDMKTAGTYLGDGLISGIKSKEQAAYDAGFKLGQQAVKGEKDGQKSKSPSRLTMQAGRWLGEGLVIGMEQMGSSVYNTGKEMGEKATDSISTALSLLTGLDESDLDVNPTITPVLDLTDVRNGASTINDMLDSSVNANLGSITAMTNQQIQNGANDDVVTAIEKLNRSLNGLEKPTYNINGVTYDDGSNISNAVESLVRAARVERRV